MAIPLTSTEAATSLASTVVPTAVAVLGSVVFTVAGVTVDVVVCVAVAAVCVLETAMPAMRANQAGARKSGGCGQGKRKKHSSKNKYFFHWADPPLFSIIA